VYQLLAGGAGDEGPDDIRVCDVGELGALLRESPDEISERLIRLLPTAPVSQEFLGRTYVAWKFPTNILTRSAQP